MRSQWCAPSGKRSWPTPLHPTGLGIRVDLDGPLCPVAVAGWRSHRRMMEWRTTGCQPARQRRRPWSIARARVVGQGRNSQRLIGATLSCHCATTTSTRAKTHCRRWQHTAQTADVSACEVASRVSLLTHQRTCSSTAFGLSNDQTKAPLISKLNRSSPGSRAPDFATHPAHTRSEPQLRLTPIRAPRRLQRRCVAPSLKRASRSKTCVECAEASCHRQWLPWTEAARPRFDGH